MGSGLSRSFQPLTVICQEKSSNFGLKSAAFGLLIIVAVTYWKRKQKTIEDLIKQLHAATATLSLLQSQIDLSDSESTVREQKIRELIEENGNIKKVISELKEKIVSLKEQAEAFKTKKESLIEELSAEKKELTDLKKLDEEEIQELTAANKKVSEDLEHLIVQHEQKENEIQCLTLTLTQIRNEMSRMIEKNDQEERERKTIFARQLADLVAKERENVVPFAAPCSSVPLVNNNSADLNGKKKRRRQRKKPGQTVNGNEMSCGESAHEIHV